MIELDLNFESRDANTFTHQDCPEQICPVQKQDT